MANKKRSRSSAFRTAREMAKDEAPTLDEEHRELQRRIETLEYTAQGYLEAPQVRRPYNQQRAERNKSIRLALEACLMTLVLIAIAGLLNQWLHFLW